MSEHGPSPVEQSERIPSLEEVRWLFEGAYGAAVFTETKSVDDELGVQILEGTVVEGDGQREYTYERKRTIDNDVEVSATIYTTAYDSDGMPTGGESLAKLIHGEWKVTPRGAFESTKKFV